MGRKLCIIAVGSFIVAFTIASVFGYIYQTNKAPWRSLFMKSNSEMFSKMFSSESTSSDLCLTPRCIEAAAKILSNLDEGTDPCTDFYQFACGGWMNRHPIPRTLGSVSFFGISQHELNLKLKDLLEKNLNGSQPTFVPMLKNMYETCMDLKSIEKVNSEPLKKVLKTLGGWPVVEGHSWDESAFDWIEALKSVRSLGFSHRMLLDLRIGIDYKNISNYIITISLPREAFRNSSRIYNKYTVRELQQLVPQIPWLKYLSSLLNESISEDEPLNVIDLNFVIEFGKLISTTEKRVISNYLLWRVVLQSLLNLSAEWRNLLHDYVTALTGTDEQKPRWEVCLSILSNELNIALSSYYIRNDFDEEIKEASLELYSYIHKEFLKNLENIDWMEMDSKKKAKAKVEAIKPYSGYPNELLDDNLIQDLYSDLKITNDSFFDNVLSLRKWETDYEFSLLRSSYLKRQWAQHSNAVTVNSFYKIAENSIEFLAGILRKDFFDKNRPHYMNFGAIGFVLAHELTHSLDDIGRQFDKDGNYVNWWDKTTEENFRRKAQCIIDQFSNFTAENGMQLNGINTQGESIADNGGFKLAYKAYQSWIKDNGPELKLPGLKYTPSQLFWISTTNIWCGKFRAEALKLRILTGTHLPYNFRIIGGLSNLAEFSQEFNCSPGTQMNPKNKCVIW